MFGVSSDFSLRSGGFYSGLVVEMTVSSIEVRIRRGGGTMSVGRGDGEEGKKA